MDKQEVIKAAQTKFLTGSRRKEVMDFLLENGISKDEVETVATDAYLAVKDQRQEIIKENSNEKEPIGGGGNASIVIGLIILIAGIIATATTNRIWYGAMGLGVVTMFGGMLKR